MPLALMYTGKVEFEVEGEDFVVIYEATINSWGELVDCEETDLTVAPFDPFDAKPHLYEAYTSALVDAVIADIARQQANAADDYYADAARR